jgi:hypothetical protein
MQADRLACRQADWHAGRQTGRETDKAKLVGLFLQLFVFNEPNPYDKKMTKLSDFFQ